MPHFQDPQVFPLLLLVPLLVWGYRRRLRRGEASVRFASTIAFEGVPPPWTSSIRHLLFGLKVLALALVITALARPQKGTEQEEILTEGVDIMIALDASGSMAAEDFSPRNRLFVAKNVVRTFIEGLKHDRAGLVVFAGKAMTRCPLTLDYGALMQVVDSVQLGTIEDGTAIGNALATALNRLRGSKAKSKVVILVTDGVNNRGEVQPLDAAKIAQALKAKVYTVGVGSRGTARYPVRDPNYGLVYMNLPVEIDEESLNRIADVTGGLYYRATDRPELEKIFNEIGRLEKTRIEVKTYTHYNEQFLWFLFPAVAMILMGALAECTRFQKIP